MNISSNKFTILNSDNSDSENDTVTDSEDHEDSNQENILIEQIKNDNLEFVTEYYANNKFIHKRFTKEYFDISCNYCSINLINFFSKKLPNSFVRDYIKKEIYLFLDLGTEELFKFFISFDLENKSNQSIFNEEQIDVIFVKMCERKMIGLVDLMYQKYQSVDINHKFSIYVRKILYTGNLEDFIWFVQKFFGDLDKYCYHNQIDEIRQEIKTYIRSIKMSNEIIYCNKINFLVNNLNLDIFKNFDINQTIIEQIICSGYFTLKDDYNDLILTNINLFSDENFFDRTFNYIIQKQNIEYLKIFLEKINNFYEKKTIGFKIIDTLVKQYDLTNIFANWLKFLIDHYELYNSKDKYLELFNVCNNLDLLKIIYEAKPEYFGFTYLLAFIKSKHLQIYRNPELYIWIQEKMNISSYLESNTDIKQIDWLFELNCKINNTNIVSMIVNKNPSRYYYLISSDKIVDWMIIKSLNLSNIETIIQLKNKVKCSFCFGDEPNVITNCSHQYCEDCINLWYSNKHTTCSYCKTELASLSKIIWV